MLKMKEAIKTIIVCNIAILINTSLASAQVLMQPANNGRTQVFGAWGDTNSSGADDSTPAWLPNNLNNEVTPPLETTTPTVTTQTATTEEPATEQPPTEEPSAEESEPALDESRTGNPENTTPTVTTITTTEENGNTTTTEVTKNLGAGGETIPEVSGDDNSSGSGRQNTSAKSNKPSTSNSNTGETQDINYSGVYKEHQIIPNLMAIHCKVNAEDIVKDLSLMEKCIRQYLTEMNKANASDKSEAMKDYNMLRYAVLNDTLAVAITKAASVAGYEEKMNEYAEATAETDTKYDTETALSNTQAFSTDVMNSLRELYVEMIKYEAINGLVDINPHAIVDEEETAKGRYAKQQVQTKADQSSAQSETIVRGGKFVGNNQCETDGAVNACSDGIHQDQYGNYYTCEDGICANGADLEKGTFQEPTIVGKVDWEKYEQMTPQEFAQHKDEIEKLKAGWTEQMNSALASDADIANAQMSLERMATIEAQKLKGNEF